MVGFRFAYAGDMHALRTLFVAVATIMMTPVTVNAGGMDFVPDANPQATARGDSAARSSTPPTSAKPWDGNQSALAFNFG
jgi:hypothetical protein